MTGRPKKELPIPDGLRRGMLVKVTSPEFKGTKLGIIVEMCKYKDGGINVKLAKSSLPGVTSYTCIQIERGDTIESVELIESEGARPIL